MAGYGGFSFLDHDGERANTSFYTGNITATSLPGTLTDFGNLRTAVSGIIVGTVASETLKVFETKLANTLPSSPQAQRESKWLVVYEDDQAFFDPPVNAIPNEGYRKVFTVEIPTADLSQLITNTDKLDISVGTPGETFVNAFEQIARSPYGGTVNVLEIRHVGRRL